MKTCLWWARHSTPSSRTISNCFLQKQALVRWVGLSLVYLATYVVYFIIFIHFNHIHYINFNQSFYLCHHSFVSEVDITVAVAMQQQQHSNSSSSGSLLSTILTNAHQQQQVLDLDNASCSNEEVLTEEVSRYSALSATQQDPLQFRNSRNFPLLATTAQTFLAIQATNCSSERVNSTASQVLTDKRLSLSKHISRPDLGQD